MSKVPTRVRAISVSLMIAICAAVPACAMEKPMSATAEVRAVDAREVFADPRVAELAEAIASGGPAPAGLSEKERAEFEAMQSFIKNGG